MRATKIIVPLLLCLVLTIILTYPLLFELGNRIERGDGILNAWIMSWNIHAFLTQPWDIFNANIFFPAQKTLLFSENLLGTLPLTLPCYFLGYNPIKTYHLVIFFGFFLSCYGAYLLSFNLCKDHGMAVIAGILYSFCTYKMTHIWWLQLTQSQWIPFALLFLHRFFATKDLPNIILFAVFFCWQALSCMYYAVFLSLVTCFAILYYGFHHRGSFLKRENLIKLAIGFAFILLILGPIIYQFGVAKNLYGLTRSDSEITAGSANVISYWSSPAYNHIWGSLNYNLRPTGVPWEKFNFIGLTFWGYIIGLIVLSWTKNRTKLLHAWFYFALMFVAILISCGPQLYVGHVLIGTNPFYYITDLLPGFSFIRVPARMAIISMLALALSSSIIFSELANLAKPLKIIITLVFLVMVLTDHSYIPIKVTKKQTFSPHSIPQVYQWLKRQPGDFPIIEVPFNQSLWRETEYMYYSTFHWKKLVNGYSGFLPPNYTAVSTQFRHFPSPEGIEWARINKIRYIIWHKALGRIDEKKLKEFIDQGKLKLIAAFEQDYVFELPSESS